MEQHRDEALVCASCGSSFLLSASEAASFAEKGLAAPKRCKECRRARREHAKETGGHDMGNHPARAHGRMSNGAGMRHRTQRYTGDVNEYRSPMPDPGFPGARGGTSVPWGARTRSSDTPAFRDDHRAPSYLHGQRAQSNDRRRAAPPDAQRRRAPAQVFDITCDECGVSATVPFKPDEGREIFCPTCYRARKSPPTA